MAPTKRASFGMVAHRDRAYLFGGVTDMAGAGDKLYSELHDGAVPAGPGIPAVAACGHEAQNAQQGMPFD